MNTGARSLLAVAAAVVSLVAGARIASATPFTATLPATKDSLVRRSNRNTNEGANEILSVRRDGKGRAVVGFDLTGHTTGVTSARLVLGVKRSRGSWAKTGRPIDAA